MRSSFVPMQPRKTALLRLCAFVPLWLCASLLCVSAFLGLGPCVVAGERFTPAREGEGRLELVQGVPIVHLKGTPEQIGRQHGKLLAEPIHVLLERYIGGMIGNNGPGKLARAATLAVSRQMKISPEYRREMQAMAEGAGVSLDDVLLVNTVFDLKKAAQCSAMAAFGGATRDRLLYFGRALDFPSMGIAHLYSVVFIYEPEGGRKFVSVSFPGLVGVLSGMNDAGLAAAILECYGHGVDPAAMPYAMLYRQVVEHSKTTDQAIELLRAGSHSTGNNLMICDATPSACVVEMTPRQFAVRKPTEGILTALNHFESPELQQKPDDARITMMQGFREQRGQIDLDVVKQTLVKTALGDTNLQAMVFVPQERVVHLAIGEPPAAERKYVTFSAQALGLAEDEPQRR